MAKAFFLMIGKISGATSDMSGHAAPDNCPNLALAVSRCPRRYPSPSIQSGNSVQAFKGSGAVEAGGRNQAS
jgi:hypothetical protein